MTRLAQSIVTIELPLPPSVNKAFASAGNTHLVRRTESYRFWQRQVRDEHGAGAALPVLAPGEYGLLIELPGAMRGDSDNRTKLLSDILKPKTREAHGLGIVRDDKLMRPHYVDFDDALPAGRVRLRIVTLVWWRPYLMSYLEGWA